jgi:hypothetical protein
VNNLVIYYTLNECMSENVRLPPLAFLTAILQDQVSRILIGRSPNPNTPTNISAMLAARVIFDETVVFITIQVVM